MTEFNTSLRSGATSHQATFDTLVKQLTLGGNYRSIPGEYINLTASEEDNVVGQVMGVIAASGKWTRCKSGASDGSQIPRGILLSAVKAEADEEIDAIEIMTFGDVNRDLVILDGNDTLATQVSGVRMEEHLVANSKGLQFRTVADNSEYDN